MLSTSRFSESMIPYGIKYTSELPCFVFCFFTRFFIVTKYGAFLYVGYSPLNILSQIHIYLKRLLQYEREWFSNYLSLLNFNVFSRYSFEYLPPQTVNLTRDTGKTFRFCQNDILNIRIKYGGNLDNCLL